MTDLLRTGAHLKLGRGAVAAAAPGSSCYRLSQTAISVGHRDSTLSQSVSLVIVLVGVTSQLSQICHNGYACVTYLHFASDGQRGTGRRLLPVAARTDGRHRPCRFLIGDAHVVERSVHLRQRM